MTTLEVEELFLKYARNHGIEGERMKGPIALINEEPVCAMTFKMSEKDLHTLDAIMLNHASKEDKVHLYEVRVAVAAGSSFNHYSDTLEVIGKTIMDVDVFYVRYGVSNAKVLKDRLQASDVREH